MLNISGLIPYLVTQKVCQSMNHLMSSRQRKNDSSSDRMKKLQKDRSCNIHNSMPACLQFNSLVSLILNTGMGQVTKWAILSLHCQVFLDIISMASLVVQLEDPTDTLRVGLPVGIIRIVEIKVEATMLGHIHNRLEAHRLILEILLRPMDPVQLLLDMELHLIIPKVGNMEFLVGEVRTHKAETETSHMVGSNSMDEQIACKRG